MSERSESKGSGSLSERSESKGPERTCVGCRRKAERGELLRFVLVDGAPVADPTSSAPGRGAWLHDSDECRAAAERRRALPRALRADLHREG